MKHNVRNVDGHVDITFFLLEMPLKVVITFSSFLSKNMNKNMLYNIYQLQESCDLMKSPKLNIACQPFTTLYQYVTTKSKMFSKLKFIHAH